jgi:hypothetical protein
MYAQSMLARHWLGSQIHLAARLGPDLGDVLPERALSALVATLAQHVVQACRTQRRIFL